jgi:hypothetical protein
MFALLRFLEHPASEVARINETSEQSSASLLDPVSLYLAFTLSNLTENETFQHQWHSSK